MRRLAVAEPGCDSPGTLPAELHEARALWQWTLDSLTASVAVLDEHAEIVAVNAAWRQIAESAGNGSDQVGLNYIAVCQAAADPLADAVAQGLRDVIAGDRSVFELEYPCHSPTLRRWFMLRASRYDGPGPLRVVVSHEDITAGHQERQQLTLQTALLDQIDASVIVTDLDATVVSWNAGAQRLHGWSAEEALGRNLSEILSPAAAAAAAAAGADADTPRGERSVAPLQRFGRSGEYTVSRKDGSTFPAEIRCRSIVDEDGRYAGVINVAIDVTERHASERALQSAREYLQAVTDSIGEGVIALDSDGRVTYLNEAAGDLLGWSSEELCGEPFDPILHGSGRDGSPPALAEFPIGRARGGREAIRVEDDVFVRRDGAELPVAYIASPFAIEEEVQGCVVVFEDISERKAQAERVARDLEKLAWLDRIQDALRDDRFVLYAQPIVDLRTEQIVQRELLIRMRSPDRAAGGDGAGTVVGPGAFLPVAEEYGVINEIDRWVIDRSTEIAAGGHPVEINVSGRSVTDPNLVDYIRHAMRRAGCRPADIVFEITETTLIADEQAGRRFVEGLHGLGCKIALDDFGTGYGGFTYIKQLPIDFLKIDIQFVRDLLTSHASRHVVQAVVSLAAGFSLKTVGEGVEDQRTFDLLRELGVDYAQGFHIGRPAPIEGTNRRGSIDGSFTPLPAKPLRADCRRRLPADRPSHGQFRPQ